MKNRLIVLAVILLMMITASSIYYISIKNNSYVTGETPEQTINENSSNGMLPEISDDDEVSGLEEATEISETDAADGSLNNEKTDKEGQSEESSLTTEQAPASKPDVVEETYLLPEIDLD